MWTSVSVLLHTIYIDRYSRFVNANFTLACECKAQTSQHTYMPLNGERKKLNTGVIKRRWKLNSSSRKSALSASIISHQWMCPRIIKFKRKCFILTSTSTQYGQCQLPELWYGLDFFQTFVIRTCYLLVSYDMTMRRRANSEVFYMHISSNSNAVSIPILCIVCTVCKVLRM